MGENLEKVKDHCYLEPEFLVTGCEKHGINCAQGEDICETWKALKEQAYGIGSELCEID